MRRWQVSFEAAVDTECSDRRRVVIFDERMTVSKLMPIHAAIFTGCMLLNVILCLGKNRRTTEKSNTSVRTNNPPLFILIPSFAFWNCTALLVLPAILYLFISREHSKFNYSTV